MVTESSRLTTSTYIYNNFTKKQFHNWAPAGDGQGQTRGEQSEEPAAGVQVGVDSLGLTTQIDKYFSINLNTSIGLEYVCIYCPPTWKWTYKSGMCSCMRVSSWYMHSPAHEGHLDKDTACTAATRLAPPCSAWTSPSSCSPALFWLTPRNFPLPASKMKLVLSWCW